MHQDGTDKSEIQQSGVDILTGIPITAQALCRQLIPGSPANTAPGIPVYGLTSGIPSTVPRTVKQELPSRQSGGGTVHHHGPIPPRTGSGPSHTNLTNKMSNQQKSSTGGHSSSAFAAANKLLMETKSHSGLSSTFPNLTALANQSSTGPSPKKKIKVEEKPPPTSEIANYRKLVHDNKIKEMLEIKENYIENLSELFSCKMGGNMMDYFVWTKRPTPQLVNFLKSSNIDSDDEEDHGLERKINNEVKVLTCSGSNVPIATPVAISTTLPPSVAALNQQGSCQRLGLTSLAYLWRRDQSELLKEMIDSGVSAILIKVASMGLNPKTHLGRNLKELYPQLIQMNKEFQLNVCGEGGEYETFTGRNKIWLLQTIVETLKDRVAKSEMDEIEINKEIASNSVDMNMDQFKENEELKTCGAPLKRKKGQFSKSKPGKDGLCWRHSKEPHQQEDNPVVGNIVVKTTMKELREIAKKEGLKGYSREPKGELVKLIETNSAHKFTCEEVFTKKELKTIAKRRGITNYSRLGRADLTELSKHYPQHNFRCTHQKEGPKSAISTTGGDGKNKPSDRRKYLRHSPFRSTLTTITESTDLELEIAFMVEKVKENMAKYMREGSGWTFDHIEKLEIHLNKFEPLKGSTYIALPKPLAQKKAIINVQNTDQECLRWAILSALHHEEVDKNCTKRVGQYKKWADELNFDGIDFPVSLKAIDKFERQNTDLNINVFGFDCVKKGEDEDEDL
ncbi:unnamed protein product [Mytilus edulis]|uniref:Diphthine--ammonia ligase n=1 Tax=Mytilus edulis TaxID=6550 RepID=A0A8S3PUM1_MYTED|nr:unnamed protein product [Mytilus edulis]